MSQTEERLLYPTEIAERSNTRLADVLEWIESHGLETVRVVRQSDWKRFADTHGIDEIKQIAGR